MSERKQLFHDNSEQCNETMKSRFIELGRTLDEWLNDSKVLTEAVMLLRKTDKQAGVQEEKLLVSALDNMTLRSLLTSLSRELTLVEVNQGRTIVKDLNEKDEEVPTTTLYDACYAAHIAAAPWGTAAKLLHDFQHRAGLEDEAFINTVREKMEGLSATLLKSLVSRCADKNHCAGPDKCPLNEKLE